MKSALVTTKGQIVIPREIRAQFHIKKGTRVCFEPRNGEIVLKPINPEYYEKMAGILGTGGQLTKFLLEERAKDREREDKKWHLS